MLSNSRLSGSFSAEPLMYACLLINKLSSSAVEGKTLIEIWLGEAAQDNNSLRIFECPAYYHVKEDKLDPKAKKCVFWGFKINFKGYNVGHLEGGEYVTS